MTSKSGLSDVQIRRISNVIRQERQAAAITQEHLAVASCLSLRTIKRAERGEALSSETLRAIAAVLNLDAVTLIRTAEAQEQNLAEGEDWIRPWRRSYLLPNDSGVSAMITSLLFILPIAWSLCYLWTSKVALEMAPIAAALSVFPYSFIPTFVLKLGGLGNNIASDPGRRPAYYYQRMKIAVSFIIISDVMLTVIIIFFGASVFALPALVAVEFVLTVCYCIHHEKRAKALLETARHAFNDRMPGILDEIRDAVSRPTNFASITTVKKLTIEAQRLADDCDRSGDIQPLEFLVEDLLRGISGRSGIGDYVLAARLACLGQPAKNREDRFRSDLWILTDDLRRRVSTIS